MARPLHYDLWSFLEGSSVSMTWHASISCLSLSLRCLTFRTDDGCSSTWTHGRRREMMCRAGGEESEPIEGGDRPVYRLSYLTYPQVAVYICVMIENFSPLVLV
ncbi:hypothetical protein RRG08_052093 [Elysia crispata]|uniref:Uncharacterized protein n=1 Tax=Elysia crispata TaxID=231223 RepID=A0AAE1A641_9GAST|nr:hypothetical protein RRG08_052093 [Elysia crispata]